MATVLLMCAVAADAAPQSARRFQSRGFEPLAGEALRELIVGRSLLVEELSTHQRFEAMFLPSGVRLLRPRGELVAGIATLRAQDLTGVAQYSLETDRVTTTLEGAQQLQFQIYRVGDATYAHRLRDGDEVRWRVLPREVAKADLLLATELIEQGIEPLPGPRLRQLVTGRALTLLQRSTGELIQVRFALDGTSSTLNADGTASTPVRYSVFRNQLVTTIDERPVYVTVYETTNGFLGALNTDRGIVDWEIVYRE